MFLQRKIILEHTHIKHMRVYGDAKMYFFYNESLGVYTTLSAQNRGAHAEVRKVLAETRDIYLT